MNYHGTLIYRERNRRNWSQEGLCRGICTVSYLSKIENGKAEPSEEILRMLLERLELHTAPELEAESRQAAEEAYELLFSGRFGEFSEAMKARPAEKYRAAAAGLDFLLLEQFAAAEQPLSEDFETCMEPRQLALQRLMQKRHSEAIALMPNAFCHWKVGSRAYAAGDYASALEHLQAGYDLAARDGAPHLMMDCKAFIGNCYCQSGRLDLGHMLSHYAVARRLASALGEHELIHTLDYNIAASQIELGQYEEAYAYFSALQEPNLMALHKLAICCEKTGRTNEAFAALDLADTMESEQPRTELARLICALVRFRLQHADYPEHEEYGRMLMECFESCRRELPVGYASFHMPWVIEYLTSTRQYKRAFELTATFPTTCALE